MRKLCLRRSLSIVKELTQSFQRIIMNASITAHSILGVVLWHRKMRLIQWCVVDTIHEIRSIWLLGLEPWDLDAWRCDIVNCHIAGRWWNWRKREKRRWTWYKFNVIQLNGKNINMIYFFNVPESIHSSPSGHFPNFMRPPWKIARFPRKYTTNRQQNEWM